MTAMAADCAPNYVRVNSIVPGIMDGHDLKHAFHTWILLPSIPITGPPSYRY
jgi:hypothetical protein